MKSVLSSSNHFSVSLQKSFSDNVLSVIGVSELKVKLSHNLHTLVFLRTTSETSLTVPCITPLDEWMNTAHSVCKSHHWHWFLCKHSSFYVNEAHYRSLSDETDVCVLILSLSFTFKPCILIRSLITFDVMYDEDGLNRVAQTFMHANQEN